MLAPPDELFVQVVTGLYEAFFTSVASKTVELAHYTQLGVAAEGV